VALQVFAPHTLDCSFYLATMSPKKDLPKPKDLKEAASPAAAMKGQLQEQMVAKIDRIKKIIEGISEQSPEKVKPYLKSAAPFLAVPIAVFLVSMPYIGMGVQKARTFIKSLPDHVLWATIGFTLCFFGGVFPATVAAVEAWNMYDGCKSLGLCDDLYNEALKILAKSDEDDQKDEDKDGIKDVDQMAPHKLFLRKTSLAMRTMDPEKVSGALTGLCTGWVAVLATLKVQFARVATLGAAIGDKFYSVVQVTIEPALKKMSPDEYDQWITVACRLTCKAWAIHLCWWIQRYVSAFHCAVRGGLMLGREVVAYLNEKGYIKFSHESTYMDEVIAWSTAAVGLWIQVSSSFGLPFPLNIVLLPLQFVEGFVVWSIMS